MKNINLTQNKVAIVDDEDFEELSKHKWGCGTGGYARRAVYEKNKQIMIFMHVEILGALTGMEIDHINRDPLDNRKENLRHVTHQQNMFNVEKHKGFSVYKGVCWNKKRQKWRAYIVKNQKQYYLGMHQNEKDAAMAYNTAACNVFGEFAVLNDL